jgi:23S rRNA pseudouridine1911/1915/1917 synthase
MQKKVSYKIAKNDFILCTVLKPPPIELVPENIPLNIIYEDDYLLIVNKTAGMCVHPGIGNRYGTLINALLYHFGIRENLSYRLEYSEDDFEENDDDSEIITDNFQHTVKDNRPGLVHRIDKDTTGLLVIAKNVNVHNHLSKQFANKTTEREYFAIVWGKPKNDKGRIEGNIGRSTRDRTSFAVLERDGKPAITDYEVVERFAYTALLKFKLLTGRTHQIRVHSGSIGHKLFGDVRYGGNKILFGLENPQWKSLAQKSIDFVGRQMLHAKTLGFIHPITQEKIIFDSELPDDMQKIIAEMRIFSNE